MLGPRQISAVVLLAIGLAAGAWTATASPTTSDDARDAVDRGRWWSFAPVESPPVPSSSAPGSPDDPIDAFVLAGLERAGLRAAPIAGDRELVRRAHFDLLGLPPTFEEVERYAADPSPDKWERLIDRLLESPRYGERWGRRWLDVVRFAQTDGYERDDEKPFSWRYRDWVIRAFNEDLPYDQFVTWQIAGDLLPDPTADMRIASGFHHLGAWDEEPDDAELAEYDGYDDVLRTVAEGFLGVTIGCARCHDHKTDPISQRNYYEMLAFLRGVEAYRTPTFAIAGSIVSPLDASAEAVGRWRRDKRAVLESLQARQDEIRQRALERVLADPRQELSPRVREALSTPSERRTQQQRSILIRRSTLAMTREEALAVLALEQQLSETSSSFRGDLDWVLVAAESEESRPTHVLGRGSPAAPGAEVSARFPPALCVDVGLSTEPERDSAGGAPRAALARWIADPRHPSTARVLVNRVWQGHFGRGIVATPNDFGVTGARPTHPELLDWLSRRFVESGYRVKALHRLIMRSATYRRSSRFRDPHDELVDPANDRLWRQNPRRLEAEAIRDAALAVGDSLELTAGGRGFFPTLSREALAGMSRPGEGWGWSPLEERRRRSVYIYAKRGLVTPLLEVLDLANPNQPVGRRAVTTIVSQALTLTNGRFFNECAERLADEVYAEVGDAAEAQVTRAFQRALQRDPTERERSIASRYLADQSAGFAARTPSWRFRFAQPTRLAEDYLDGLPVGALLEVPGAGWTVVPGVFGKPYNGTVEVDRVGGPAAILDDATFPIASMRARVRVRAGAGPQAFLLRATVEGDIRRSLQLELDAGSGSVRLLVHDGAFDGAQVLAEGRAALEEGRWCQVEARCAEGRVSVSIDGERALAADADLDLGACFGVRVLGDGLELSEVALRGAGRLLEPRAELASPARRALDAFCLLLLNLNEFVYVD